MGALSLFDWPVSDLCWLVSRAWGPGTSLGSGLGRDSEAKGARLRLLSPSLDSDILKARASSKTSPSIFCKHTIVQSGGGVNFKIQTP